MKKILLIISLAVLTFSCDKIEKDNYFDESIQTFEYTNRNVLLMEMTAFRCNNCPPASKEADRIIKLHQGKVIGMNVHASSLADPQKASDPILFNNASIGLWNKSGRPDLPSGMINYFGTSTNFNNSFISWASDIEEELKIETHLNITLDTDTLGNNNFSVAVNLEYVGNQLENERLAVYLVEDGVIGRQLDGANEINDYVHNHITRETLSDISGVEIFESLGVGDTKIEQFDFTLPAAIENQNNVKVVAIVFNPSNDYIYQVNEVDLIEEE
ncbi:Omp28-related outer membrane protein [Candidatus Kapabacteria bacterium]|nr:Omp28-related outer membrane protein [Candidatus Kapabacteria bacterium]